MPLSETFVHSRAYLSLRKQSPSSCFVSLWSQTWPLCLESRGSACIPLTLTLTFQFCILPGAGGPQDHCSPRPSGGGKHVAISSACMVSTWRELFVADESPSHQLHRPLYFKEPVINLTTPSSLSNQTPDLIVFQHIIGVPVARLKL